jgi:hypothetical protein
MTLQEIILGVRMNTCKGCLQTMAFLGCLLLVHIAGNNLHEQYKLMSEFAIYSRVPAYFVTFSSGGQAFKILIHGSDLQRQVGEEKAGDDNAEQKTKGFG